MLRTAYVPKNRWMHMVAGLGCGLGATVAQADVVFDFDGDAGTAPYYQSFTYSSIKDHTTGDIEAYHFNDGLLHSDNISYQPQSMNSTFTLNGATVTASASVNPGGFYTSRNTASVSITNANAQDGYYVLGGYGSMTSAQFFSASALADHATFTWRVTGQESPTPPGACNPSIEKFDLCSSARIDFSATSTANPNYFDDLLNDPNRLTAFGPGTYTYSIAGMPLNQVITFGYWTSAFVQIEPGMLTQGGNYNFYANYANTFDLVGVDLFDATNNLITDWTLQDVNTGENVFTPAGRVAVATSVPEPSSLALMGAALAGLGLARSRRMAARRVIGAPLA